MQMPTYRIYIPVSTFANPGCLRAKPCVQPLLPGSLHLKEPTARLPWLSSWHCPVSGKRPGWLWKSYTITLAQPRKSPPNQKAMGLETPHRLESSVRHLPFGKTSWDLTSELETQPRPFQSQPAPLWAQPPSSSSPTYSHQPRQSPGSAQIQGFGLCWLHPGPGNHSKVWPVLQGPKSPGLQQGRRGHQRAPSPPGELMQSLAPTRWTQLAGQAQMNVPAAG